SIKTIAIVVKSFMMQHHMVIADKINEHFSRKGYDIMMCESGSDEETVSRFLQRMIDKSVDGIIFIGSTFQLLSILPVTDALLKSIPVVIANGWLENSYGIVVDEEEGAEMLARHIHSTGKKKAIFLHSSNTESCRNKISGFKKYAAEHPDFSAKVVNYSPDLETLEQVLHSVEYDVVVAEDDILAAKVLRIFLSKGMRIPEDVAVAGFNNSNLSSLTYPTITSVDNRAGDQGMECAVLLEKILSGSTDAPKEKKVHKVIPCTLVVRESTQRKEI
ncbi:MAG: LacI family DNA-binding transcriptional regulator, partial [Candidatus Ornithospirochaeta sp.]